MMAVGDHRLWRGWEWFISGRRGGSFMQVWLLPLRWRLFNYRRDVDGVPMRAVAVGPLQVRVYFR